MNFKILFVNLIERKILIQKEECIGLINMYLKDAKKTEPEIYQAIISDEDVPQKMLRDVFTMFYISISVHVQFLSPVFFSDYF